MPKLAYKNIGPLMAPHVHGFHAKDLAVLHETVSPDIVGWKDITNNADYLAAKDYGIHGLTDMEGHIAWALGLGNAIFWQTGGVNTRSIGIEQVSPIPLADPSRRRKLWAVRDPQLRATAKLLAAWHNVDRKGHPLVFSDGLRPGVTSHWNVSQHFPQSEGHFDCHPVHQGGYYPILSVIAVARTYAKLGYRF